MRAAFAEGPAYSLHARVGAVEMDAVTVADDETVDRIEQFVVKDYVHAELDLLTRFNDRDWFVRLVQQLDFQNLRAAVAVTISELGSIDVFSSGLRLFANELGLGISSSPLLKTSMLP